MRLSCGTVQGAAARKYPGFTYLRPVIVPFTYPFSPRVYEPVALASPIKTVELADYRVDANPVCPPGAEEGQRRKMWVTMLPNQHTIEKKPQIVLEVTVAETVWPMAAVDELVRMAFHTR